MQWFPNPNRIREVFETEKVKMAAETLLSYRNMEVLQVVVYCWLLVLTMVFSMLVTIRLAFSIPLFHG